jgi:hypothetical protein
MRDSAMSGPLSATITRSDIAELVLDLVLAEVDDRDTGAAELVHERDLPNARDLRCAPRVQRESGPSNPPLRADGGGDVLHILIR